MSSVSQLIPNLFRTEYRKMVSVLCKHFGLTHIELAEDLVSETFLLASENWPVKGIPEQPVAWLYAVAKNKTLDYLKRSHTYHNKVLTQVKDETHAQADSPDFSTTNITDAQLRMMFTLCHPILSTESQLTLSLKILCGLSTDEIAAALFTTKENIKKRLSRGKEKLRMANVSMELPDGRSLQERLNTVLTILYLLFNEGYYSEHATHKIRTEFCVEATHLTHLLTACEQTATPEVFALLSLMCFQGSRLQARLQSPNHNPVLYENQDRNLWDTELIHRGMHYLIKAASPAPPSSWHIEAAIAYWHTLANPPADKWQHVLQLYNQLLQINYSPMAALNRTFALWQVSGAHIALTEAQKLNMHGHPVYETLIETLKKACVQ